jgi:hypothetical protein
LSSTFADLAAGPLLKPENAAWLRETLKVFERHPAASPLSKDNYAIARFNFTFSDPGYAMPA